MPDKMTPYKKQLIDIKSYFAQNKWADCQGVVACQIFLHIVKRISAELSRKVYKIRSGQA